MTSFRTNASVGISLGDVLSLSFFAPTKEEEVTEVTTMSSYKENKYCQKFSYSTLIHTSLAFFI